jgi:eukaryotic-like serine/threonine-protein kinase
LANDEESGDEASAHAPTVLAAVETTPAPRLDAPVVDPKRYDIQGELARGGLGRILRAHDRRLRRSVAIKQPHPDRPQDVDLLLREAFVTAHLEHPGIVPVHDAGYWPDGTPFYATKLVHGRTLASVMGEAKTWEQRSALLPHLIAIADAIAYAHSQQVLHRDLKPANVLVGAFGETVVVDWGLARWHDSGTTPAPSPEGPTSIAGTPGYMAPEQARGELVDERADLYALGAILHQLLVGEAPHHGGSTEELLERVARTPVPPVASRAGEVPADLAAIVDKALAFDPRDRYQSCADLAEELRRFQTGRLVAAHRYRRADLVSRWTRRNQLTVRVGAVLLVALIALGAWITWRSFAEQRRDAERVRTLILEQAERALERDPTEAVAWLRALELDDTNVGPASVIATAARSGGVSQRVVRTHENIVWGVAASPDGRLLASGSADRDVVVYDARGLERHRFTGAGEALAVTFAPGSDVLAVASADGRGTLIDLEGRPLASFVPRAGPLWTAIFSPDGQLVASGGHRGTLFVWRRDGGEVRRSRPRRGPVRFTAFAEAGRTVLGLTGEGSLIRLALDTGTDVDLDLEVSAAAVDPSGGRVVVTHRAGTVVVWELGGSRKIFERVLSAPAASVWFAPDGQAAWVGHEDGSLSVWDLLGGEADHIAAREKTPVVMGLPLADGHRAVVAFDNGVVAVADRQSRTTMRWRGHTGNLMDLALVPGGGFLTGGTEGTTRIWPMGPQMVVVGTGAAVDSFALDPSEQVVVVARQDGRIETSAGILLAGEGPPATMVRVSPTGRVAFARGGRLATAALDGTGLVACPVPFDVIRLAFARDGETVLTAGSTGAVYAVEPSCRARVLGALVGEVADVVVAPLTDEVIAFGRDRRVTAFPVAGGPRRIIGEHELASLTGVFTPDGRQLVTSGHDRAVRLWSLDGDASRVLLQTKGYVDQLALSREGRLLASAGASPVIHLGDLTTGQTRLLRGHTETIDDIALAPDGKRLVSASNDGTFRLWDLRSGRSAPLANGPRSPSGVTFTKDGRWIIGAGGDGTVRRWANDVPDDPIALKRWLSEITEEHVDPRTLEATGQRDAP